MSKLDGKTLDIEEQNIKKLKQLFPEVDTDGKIDFDKLKQVLGEYVDDSDERYNFKWNGKGEALRLSQTPSMGTLRPAPEEGESKNWDETKNLYIEGDNLEVLKLLQKSYFGKIKMIYIDPPYNTGNDFVYPDNFKDNIKNYKKLTGQVDDEGKATNTNKEYSGRYHTDWLNMMYPRLRLARNLMTDDGVIFISIDDNEVHNLRKICDEVFGEDNFIGEYIWRKKTGASDSNNISNITESILLYAKKIGNEDFKLDEKGFNKNRYNLQDKYVKYRGKHYIDNLDRGGIRYSDSLNYGIECPDGTITYPNGRREFKNDGWTWTWGRDKVTWGIENGFITFKRSKNKKSGWGVYYKNYLKVNNKNEKVIKGVPYKNLINDIINTEATKEMGELFGQKVFQYTKPSRLIQRLTQQIKLDDEDIILDFFAGSSTTAHAVMDLNAEDNGNRKHIMVQLPEPTDKKSEAYKAGYENIAEIGKERIRRAGEKIKSELEEKYEAATEEERKNMKNPEELDIGFKVFKLDSSNIKEWNPGKYDDIQMAIEDSVNPYVEGRTEEDVVYEMILKMGLDLTAPVEKHEKNGKIIYSIGYGLLMICLSDNIELSIAQKMIEIKDENNQTEFRTIFRDEGFNSDTDKTNIKETLKSAGLAEEAFITL